MASTSPRHSSIQQPWIRAIAWAGAFLLIAATSIWAPVASAFSTPTFVRAWGNPSSMTTPSGIAVDGAGAIYVSDASQNQIQKFDSSGSLVLKWGSHGSGPGQFSDPLDVALDPTGNVYAMDTQNNRVEKFSSGGSYLSSIGSCCALSGPGGEFNLFPQSVAVDGSGNLYVADSGNNRIQKFDSNGNFVSMWGSTGMGDGQFEGLRTITVSSSGTVYAVDEGNAGPERIEAFDLTGTYLTKWGSSGAGPSQFDHPWGISTDGAGNVYLADTGNNRVQVFSSAGTYLGQWGSSGSAHGQFSGPTDVAILGSSIFVTDAGNSRVQEFTLAPVAALPATWGKVKSIYH